MTPDIQWYLDYIKREIEKLEEGRFTGNVDFKVNFKEGNVANMNCILSKSVKRTEAVLVKLERR